MSFRCACGSCVLARLWSCIANSLCTNHSSLFRTDFSVGFIWRPWNGEEIHQPLGVIAFGLMVWSGAVINTGWGFTTGQEWTSGSARRNQKESMCSTLSRIRRNGAGLIPKGSPCLATLGPYSCSAPNDVNSDGSGSDADFSNFITARGVSTL